MENKSFYGGYYGSFYNKAGKRMAQGDIVLNANGDIVEKATGDIVLNAKGDIIRAAKGDIVKNAKGMLKSYYDNYYGGYYNKAGTRMATGDIVKNAGGEGCFWYDLGYDSYAEYKTDWGADALPDECTDDSTDKGGKVFSFINNLLGAVESGVDIKNKYESGGTVQEGGVQFDYQPGQATKDMTMWYVAGGAIVILVIAGIALKK